MTATTAPPLAPGPWPDQDPYVRQADCPSWCSIHPQDGARGEPLWVWLHKGKVTVGEMTVDLFREVYPSPDTLGDYALLPQVDVAYGPDLLDLAAAVTLARETLLADEARASQSEGIVLTVTEPKRLGGLAKAGLQNDHNRLQDRPS